MLPLALALPLPPALATDDNSCVPPPPPPLLPLLLLLPMSMPDMPAIPAMESASGRRGVRATRAGAGWYEAGRRYQRPTGAAAAAASVCPATACGKRHMKHSLTLREPPSGRRAAQYATEGDCKHHECDCRDPHGDLLSASVAQNSS